MSDSIYRRLEVWQEAVALAAQTYTVTAAFPRSELYGLTSQLRRAAVSIASNIAEGRGRGTKREFRQFVIQARGSAYELQTQITIAQEIGYDGDLDAMMCGSETVIRLLNGLIRHLTQAPTPHPPLSTRKPP
jgi:four helix bundle protein